MPNPLSYYGQTKLDAEKIILNENDRNVVLRTTVIYGRQKRSRFTNWVIENLKNNLPVTAFTDQYNTPTLVDDLSMALRKIIELGATKIDYVKLLDINKLEKPYKKNKKYKIFIAYYLRSTRLIDNI